METVAWRRATKHGWEFRTAAPTEKMASQGWLPLSDPTVVIDAAIETAKRCRPEDTVQALCRLRLTVPPNA